MSVFGHSRNSVSEKMQARTLVKNFVEVVHQPAKAQQIKDLTAKWGGVAEASIQPQPDVEKAGWMTTVVTFFDRRKSTCFCKAVAQEEGIGSVRRSSQDVSYSYMPVQRVSTSRNGALSVLQKSKKRPVTFRLEHAKNSQRFGLVGKTNPRAFWYDENEIPDAVDEVLAGLGEDGSAQ